MLENVTHTSAAVLWRWSAVGVLGRGRRSSIDRVCRGCISNGSKMSAGGVNVCVASLDLV